MLKKRPLALSLCLFAIGCTVDQESEVTATNSSAMVELLNSIRNNPDVEANSFLNDDRIIWMQKKERPQNPIDRVRNDIALAEELLKAGKTLEAIDRIESVEPLARRYNITTRPSLENLKAISYFRLAEQQNCLPSRDFAMCTVPVHDEAVHAEQQAMRQAIALYQDILSRGERDLTSVWLLNLAYMAIGEYPEKVSKNLLISPSVFDSEYDIKNFKNVALGAGLDVVGLSGGVLLDDFNNDGMLDVVCSSWDLRDQVRYFENAGVAGFMDRTNRSGLNGITGGLHMLNADYDNTGTVDIYMLRGAWFGEQGLFPNSLLRNDGEGSFRDVTEEVGLLDFHPTQTAAWGDYNNDGWLDLYVGNESLSFQQDGVVHPSQLFTNSERGTRFTDEAESLGVDVVGYVKGVAWGDIDNDGDLDLYVSRFTESNLLYRNDVNDRHSSAFTEVGEEAGVTEPVRSFPTWFWDYDNDGWLDIFVSGYETSLKRAIAEDVASDYIGLPTDAEVPRVYRNLGTGIFADQTRELRLDRVLYTMGCSFGDLDNDGWLDFYLGTGNPNLRSLMPNRMFRNNQGKNFQDVTTAGGFGHLQKGHGVGFADLDNDGDQDIYIVLGGAYTGDVFHNALYRNPGHGNHWITLRLEGTTSNRSAIGARIELEFTEAGESRTVYATVSTGSSFGGSSLQQELGLGTTARVDRLSITWPTSKTVQNFYDLPVNKIYHIREDADRVDQVASLSFEVGGE